MKIGIYTIHADVNYGAMLQAYATQKFLKNKGYNAEIVNYYPIEAEKRLHYQFQNNSIKNLIKNIISLIDPRVRTKIKRLEEFHNSMSLSKRYFSLDEIYKTPPEYDIHIVGSDQVWNLQNGFPNKKFFFLDFVREGYKISYASSMGNPYINKDLYPQLKDLLLSFNALSTREYEGAKVLGHVTGRNIEHVVDPTFLLNAKEWEKEMCKEPLIKGKYILYYGFDNGPEYKLMLKTLRKQLNMPIVAISASINLPYNVDLFVKDAGPREFLNLFKYASFVMTSSFHGLAFSIIFRKEFYVMSHGDRMSRMESLLKKFDLDNRIIKSNDELLFILAQNHGISFNEELLNQFIENSRNWLLYNISNVSL